jgi:hypothetical protein
VAGSENLTHSLLRAGLAKVNVKGGTNKEGKAYP